jgi:hypothetical protein
MQSSAQPVVGPDAKSSEKHPVHYSHPLGWKAKQVAHFANNFHPTHVLYELGGRHMVWDSRAHRLGRFPKLKLHPSENKRLEVPPLRLFGFEWGNISWGVAQLFVWGKATSLRYNIASLRFALPVARALCTNIDQQCSAVHSKCSVLQLVTKDSPTIAPFFAVCFYQVRLLGS